MNKLKLVVFLFCVFLSINLQASPEIAPPINLPSLDGRIDLADMKGKVVYLDFWASWCKPCKQSFPWLSAIKKKFGSEGFEVIAVNLDKERALADAFLKAFEINFVVGFDAAGVTARSYKLRGMPSSYLIGRDGKIYASHVGFRDKDKAKLEAGIQQLLSAEY